ncbi:hypothetical protein [Micromonospora endolithica]|uniref:Uncharacterized protein n=1 Tax=Micromonospora endolithica TaxID=230091 RepID=A0A3A9ZK92_9ACTN|nr:hypothetical protein [Micromonospora endolithica]RKN47736.1 hypothetical protein D7223_13380 [Micromonospora endolithica]TWJ21410.1 hypothetical protein JD76_01520 [Micromonospora endolithica]
MSTYQDDPLRRPPEADAVEQRQDAIDDGPPDRMSGDVDAEASEADLAEQGSLPASTLEDVTSLPADANPADALEQRQQIPTRDDDRR